MGSLPELEQIRTMAEEVCAREGCRLYDLEFISGSKGMGRILRLLVDKENETVGIEDCSNVSRGISLLLDVENTVPGESAYTLEVSSPGLERPLRVQWHYEKVIGKQVDVKVSESLSLFNPHLKEARMMRLKGTLNSVDGEGLKITYSNQEIYVPWRVIAKAKSIYDFEANVGKKKVLNVRKG